MTIPTPHNMDAIIRGALKAQHKDLDDEEMDAIRRAYKSKVNPQGFTDEAEAVETLEQVEAVETPQTYTGQLLFILRGNQSKTQSIQKIEDPHDPENSFYTLEDNKMAYFSAGVGGGFVDTLLTDDTKPRPLIEFLKSHDYASIEALNPVLKEVFGVAMKNGIYIFPELPTSTRSVQFDLATDIFLEMKAEAFETLEEKRLVLAVSRWFERSTNRDTPHVKFSLKK